MLAVQRVTAVTIRLFGKIFLPKRRPKRTFAGITLPTGGQPVKIMVGSEPTGLVSSEPKTELVEKRLMPTIHAT